MPDKQIKTVFKVEGEQALNSAIKAANQQIRTLKSELKAETAELGRNATEQEKNAKKTESLRKQIAEQEKIVATLKEALEKSKSQFGEHADVTEKWAQKLNNARTTLATMKNDLDGIGEATTKAANDTKMATVANNALAQSYKGIGDAAGGIANGIEDIFTRVVQSVAGAIEQIWDNLSETAARANNWADIAGYWGTDAQTIQTYARSVEASANSFEDLQAAVSKIVLGGKKDAIAEMLQISDENMNDWDYAITVLGRIAEMSKSGELPDNMWETIFGERKSTKVKDLVNDWDTIMGGIKEFNGETGDFGMTDAELSAMNDMWVQINDIETKFDALKDKVRAGFGEVSLNIMTNVEGSLDAVAEFMNADTEEEKQAALDKLEENLTEFFTKLGELIEKTIGMIGDIGESLSQSDNEFLQKIGGLVTGISEAFKWLTDDGSLDKVKAGFEALFGVWATAKGISFVSTLSSVAANMQTLFGSGAGLSQAFGALGEAGATGAGITLGGAGITLTIAAAAISIANAAINTDWGKIFKTNDDLDKQAKDNGYDSYTEEATKNFVNAGPEARKQASKDLWSILTTGKPTEVWDREKTDEKKQADKFETVKIDLGGTLDDRNLAWYMDRRTHENVSMFTPEQAEAAQRWWDLFKTDTNGEGWADAFAGLESMFTGQERAWDNLNTLIDAFISSLDNPETVEDLPEWWFDPKKFTEGGLDYSALNAAVAGLPGAVASAVKESVGTITVQVNGTTIGTAVAPSVSSYIAALIE